MLICEKCQRNIANKGSLVQHRKSCDLTFELKNAIEKDYLENMLSIRDILLKYEISDSSVRNILKGKTRNLSEALKVKNEKKGTNKHTNESKEKIRNARLKWMKENPDKTAWRLSNQSFPEKVFERVLKEKKLDEHYLIVREKSEYPYFIDFAFEDIKVAVEIDGSQHNEENRKRKDIEKDKLLIEKGWRIFRVPAKNILQERDKVIEDLLLFIGSEITKINIKGIISNKEFKSEKKELEKEIRKKEKINYLNDRINYLNNIKKERGWVSKVCKDWNITHTQVRRWILKYYPTFI
jgi:very-short-patch-repair endonuclease